MLADLPPDLNPLTVTATRIEAPLLEVPAAVSSVAIRDAGLGVNLSDSLGAVPGLLARDRQNYAQDTQISVRGFGARSTFGIRGVRLYVDGIPATQPDGQGQVSHFNLATAQRVEILRGPFSALYGNSSGGVIQLFTADGAGEPSLNGGVALGSFSTHRVNVGSEGEVGSWRYNFGYMDFGTDGARGHSAATRESMQLKVGAKLADNHQLTLLYNDFDAPDAQDPLGLTSAQFNADPWQAAPVSLQFNTRKSASQRQGGVLYDWQLSDAQQLHLMGYTGRRTVLQYLSIPAGPQANPAHSGGVVDLGTRYEGGEMRWSGDLYPLQLVAGLTYDGLSQRRRGFENFIGSTLGVRGALRRDELNKVHAFDQYAQAALRLTPSWSAQLGIRHSEVQFKSDDDYVRAGNADDSGSADYSATTPVASLLWRPRSDLSLYGAFGRGFETPTFAELAYRSDGAGLNFALDPARTRHFELGTKWQSATAHAELALFRADTRDELVVASSSGGRSVYANAGRTRREGVELGAGFAFASRWQSGLTYTWLQATVREGEGALVSGNRIPGVPHSALAATLNWTEGSWQAELQGSYLSRVMVNDANAESAPPYALFNLTLSHRWQQPSSQVQVFLRVDNLLDRRYVGSVIVNDANGRFYESGAGRALLLGLRLAQ